MTGPRRGRISFPVAFALAVCTNPAPAQVTSRSFVPLRPDGNGIAAFRVRVRVDATDEPLAAVIRSIQRQARLNLVFGDDLEGLDRRVTLRDSTNTAAEALVALLAGTRLEVLVSDAGQAVIAPRTRPPSRLTVSGTIREAPSGGPVADVDVWVEGVHRHVMTDRAGRFTLAGITAGTQALVARRIGYADVRTILELHADTSLSIAMDPVPTPLSAVIVTPGTFGVLEGSLATKRTLTRDEIETAPQIGEDVFRSITRLPGVVGHDLSAAFGVRGSSNEDVLLRLDGVELIEPYHLKDVDAALSIVDLDAIGGVELTTGGFGVQHGDRLAGVFDMRTLEVTPGRPRTTLGISLTNLRAASAGSFSDGRGSWLVTARRGYIDLALELGGSDDPISPVYYDLLGKLEYSPGERFDLSAHVLHAGDRLSYASDDDNPDVESEYGSSYGWLVFSARPWDRLDTRTILSAGRVTWHRAGDRERDRFAGAVDVLDDRDYEYTGVRQDWVLDVTDRLLLRGGAEAQARSADYAYDATKEEYRITGGDRLIVVDTTVVRASTGATYTGAWLATRFQPIGSLTFELGARWDRHTHTGDSHIDPRLNAAWSINGRTTIRAAWGAYSQAHGLHQLHAADGEMRYHPAEHSEHRVIGIERSLGRGIDLRIEAYDQRLEDLRPRYVNLDNDADFLPEATSPRARIDPTDGFARGIEVFARQRAQRGFDWSVTWMLAKTAQRIDGRLVPRARDQRHAFAADAAWTSDGRWRFAASWQFHTGWPMTPATVGLDTIGTELYGRRTWGDYNATRLPAYHRLDVRISKEVRTTRGRLLFTFDVYNVYARENARAIIPYVADVRNGRAVVGRSISSMLPRLPSFGIQWTF